MQPNITLWYHVVVGTILTFTLVVLDRFTPKYAGFQLNLFSLKEYTFNVHLIIHRGWRWLIIPFPSLKHTFFRARIHKLTIPAQKYIPQKNPTNIKWNQIVSWLSYLYKSQGHLWLAGKGIKWVLTLNLVIRGCSTACLKVSCLFLEFLRDQWNLSDFDFCLNSPIQAKLHNQSSRYFSLIKVKVLLAWIHVITNWK